MAISSILFNDFQAEYKEISLAMETAFQRVCKSGYFLLGEETAAFEKELAGSLQQKYVVGVANGTEAIAIALIASNIQPGDEVIVPALTAYPTIIGVEMARAVPVVCDVDPQTGLLDPKYLPKLLTKKTKAIVPVHLYGQMCPMDEIASFATAHNLVIVEDCAQAIFARQRGKLIGSWSTAAALSFYPSKNLGAYGDAGAVMTNNPEVYERALRLRQYGQSSRYIHEEYGFNSRIDELQAAVLRAKLPHFQRWIQRRQEIAQQYTHTMKGVNHLAATPHNDHTYHLFVVRQRQRKKFLTYCEAQQLPVLIHYPRAVYQQPAFKYPVPKRCVHAEQLVEEIVSLPIHPYLSEQHVQKICRVFNGFLGR